MTIHTYIRTYISEISSVDFKQRILAFYNNTVEKNIREDTSYSSLLVKSTILRISNDFRISKSYFKYMEFRTTYQLSTLIGTKTIYHLKRNAMSIEKEQYIS